MAETVENDEGNANEPTLNPQRIKITKVSDDGDKKLHPSFQNPVRVVESPPFELSECGWGELEIGISLFFHNDVCEKQLDMYHRLKLYSEDDSGPQSTKKPVVKELYNEIVFPDPSESFYAWSRSILL